MTFPGCRFELLEPIQKDGNDWELKIWLNPKLFNGSLLFEAIDYAFLLERASLDYLTLLFGIPAIFGIFVKSARPGNGPASKLVRLLMTMLKH